MGIFSFIFYPLYDVFTIKIGNIKVLSSFQVNNYRYYYLFFLTIWRKNCSKQIFQKEMNTIIKDYPEYEDYYVFLCHSGEFYLLLHHLPQWLEKNNSEKFLFVLGKSYHESILKIFYPNIPYTNIQNTSVFPISEHICQVYSIYKGKNIYAPAFHQYFLDVENQIQQDTNIHFYDILKKHLKLKSSNLIPYIISQKANQKASYLAKNMLKNNFILLSPETISNAPLSIIFWHKISQKFKKLGYEVFTNCTDIKYFIPETYAILLNYEEIMALATHAKAIIGIRSGLLDCFSALNIPLFALYTDFPDRGEYKAVPSNKIMTGFSLGKLPNVNKDLLFEYDVNSFESEDILIEAVLERANKLNL